MQTESSQTDWMDFDCANLKDPLCLNFLKALRLTLDVHGHQLRGDVHGRLQATSATVPAGRSFRFFGRIN